MHIILTKEQLDVLIQLLESANVKVKDAKFFIELLRLLNSAFEPESLDKVEEK